jgi:catechol 2,3-dioxygenase-like lactoylglutathione lyase family enzyme
VPGSVVRPVLGTDAGPARPAGGCHLSVHSNEEAVVSHGIKTIIIPVRDLAAAKALYGTVLGAEPYADEPYYVGFRVGDQEIGLDPNGHNHGMTGPVGYCHVGDVAATLRQAVGVGWRTRQDVKDVGAGQLAAIVEDPNGNVLGFIQR